MQDPPLERLTTEARLERSARLDRMTSREIVELMNGEDRLLAEVVGAQRAAIAAAIDGIAARLRGGGRLVYCGAGTSGRLGVLDAAECPPTFHTPPDRVVALIAGGSQAIVQAVEGAEDDAGQGRADLEARRIGAADAVVGISASGRTPYVVGALQQARTAGAFTVGIACNAATPVLAAGDVAIPLVVGPEVLAGSTRLKSGTATKMVLNMLSTGAFVQLGKCYQNLMVDVQAGNEKLRQRARRIVEQATGLGPAAARALLERSGGDVKTAIVMQRCGIDAAAARARLQAAGGFVRAAIGEGERA